MRLFVWISIRDAAVLSLATEAFMLLLEQEEVNKVVLLNADVLSRKVSKRDRNSNPLIGDASNDYGYRKE